MPILIKIERKTRSGSLKETPQSPQENDSPGVNAVVNETFDVASSSNKAANGINNETVTLEPRIAMNETVTIATVPNPNATVTLEKNPHDSLMTEDNDDEEESDDDERPLAQMAAKKDPPVLPPKLKKNEVFK